MSCQVFISYRRDTGENLALLLFYRLKDLGYSVFFDVETMQAGRFNDQLFDVIDNCDDFILVLTKDALDRCSNEDDWVRIKIEYALSAKKNIVLIIAKDFEFPEHLPQSINDVRYYHGVHASTEFFDATIDKITAMLKSSPSEIESSDTNNSELFQKLLQAAYFALIGFRKSINAGDVQMVNDASSVLTECMQDLFDYSERYQFVHSEKAAVAEQIVFNYNDLISTIERFFAYEHEERMQPDAQRISKEADEKMRSLVRFIVGQLR